MGFGIDLEASKYKASITSADTDPVLIHFNGQGGCVVTLPDLKFLRA